MEYQTELDFFDTAALACRNYVSCEILDDPTTIGDDDESLFNKLYNLVFDTPCGGIERAHDVDGDDPTTTSSFAAPANSSSIVNSVSDIHTQLLLSPLPTSDTVLSEQLPANATQDGVMKQGHVLSEGVIHQQIVDECRGIQGLLEKNFRCQKVPVVESIFKKAMEPGPVTNAFQTTLLSPFQSIYNTKFVHGTIVSCVSNTTLDGAAKVEWDKNVVGCIANDQTCSHAVSPTTEILSTDPGAAVVPMEPLRPLSAYNYFFREERERILTFGSNYDRKSVIRKTLYTPEHQTVLLTNHWNQDRTNKRRHRKTHGKISFAALSKLVSQSWKELPEEHKNFYKEVAAKDWSRYQKDFAIHKSNLVSLPIPTILASATTSAATSPTAIEP